MSKKVNGNPGAERAVLAGVCQYGREAYYDVSDIIDAGCFTIESNESIWICIDNVLKNSEKVDATTILATADTLGLSSVFNKNKTDIDFLRSLFNFPIHLKNVRTMAKQVAKLDLIRKSQVKLLEAYHKLEDFDGTESTDAIVGVPEEAVFSITNSLNNQNENTPKSIGDNLVARLEHLAKNPVSMIGIPTPFPIYNNMIGGGLRSGVHLIGARPGRGKSTIAMNVGDHVSDKMNIPVLYIDTEMNLDEQENRLIAKLTGIDNRLIETGQFGASSDMRNKVISTAKRLQNNKFKHIWVGGKGFEEIVSIMRRWIFSTVKFDANGKPNPHLIIYDYFKLMNDSQLGDMQEYQAIGFQISYLSDFCKQYDTPCLSFVQLNRDGITKDTSDIISQSDRLLWLCNSCCVFRDKTPEEMIEDGYHNGNRKLHALKCRFGEPLQPNDYINMMFDGKTSTVTELKTKLQVKKTSQAENEGFITDASSIDIADLC